MKKIFIICFLSVCLLAFGVFSKANFFAVYADDFWYYTMSEVGSSVDISGVKDLSVTDLKIPSTLDGHSVAKLVANSEEMTGSYYGFTSESHKTLITSLDLKDADNLLEIDRGVFQNCVNLTGDIHLPSNLSTIGRNAFNGTSIKRVFVTSPNVVTINSTSFPTTVEVIYASSNLMNTYLTDATETDWKGFTSKYLYNISLNIDGVVKTLTTTQIKGDEFGGNYDIIAQYLSSYDVKSIKQGEDELSESLIASGDEIMVELNDEPIEIETISTPIEITYGESLNVSTKSIENATYNWYWENNAIENETNQFSYSGLSAGSYIAQCEVVVGEQIIKIETFNITVKKANYIITYPSKNNFEYFEFYADIILDNFNLDEVDAEFYYDSQKVEIFNEIGQYEVKLSLKDSLVENYEISNPSFIFNIVEEELTISWPTNVYNYTGSLIVPQYSINGNTWGYDVQLNISTDSTKSATNVGDYTIKVEGVSNKYFKLSSDTVTIFNWQIISTELIIRWELNTFDYTSEQIKPIAYGENGNIKIALNVVESGTGETNFVNADVYNVEAQLPTEYNGFTLLGDNTNTLTINPVRLDVVFTSSDSYTYNGEYIEVEAEITTEISDEVNLILSGYRYKDAGDYTAVVNGVDSPNYYIDDNITFDWTINRKVLVVNWVPNAQPLSFVYNGSVQVPRAKVETGIAGENLTLQIIADYNKYANEDATQGYLVTANLSDDVKNYTLTNSSIRYRITRAQAIISVGAECSVPYTGENQLPDYQFVGDDGALKITINGVEVTNGVKEPGTYEIEFLSAKSQNYYASTESITCLFTIMPISVSGKSEDGLLSVRATDSNGMEVEDLPVETIKDFDTSLLNDIENIDNYYFYKAVLVGRHNESLSENTKLTFELNSKSRDVRIFLITNNGLQELATTIEDGKVIIDGRQGEYVILVEKQNWWTTAMGITTICIIVFAVVVAGLFVSVMARPKKFELDKQVNSELEQLIKQKAKNGENLTSEDIKRLRKEIKNKINKENHKK